MSPALAKLLIIVLVVGVAVALVVRRNLSTISGPAARQAVADGAVLVDVRSPDEYARGHIDGAINIPVGEIAGRMDELGDPSGPVVLYCRSGSRSARALRTLTNQGFTRVENLGAMSRW